MSDLDAVLFDFSGTLFRLEGDESWFDGMELDPDDGRELDAQVQAELMHHLTAPTGPSVAMTPEARDAWAKRDLAPNLHREAYLHALRAAGLAEPHTESLYGKAIDPDSWTPYPDTTTVLAGLRGRGIKTAVVSNIAFDLRPAFAALGPDGTVDEFVLSFEVGAVKPNPAIFETALERLGVPAGRALMVGDSDEADGGARALGCAFALVDPLPTTERRDGLISALRSHGIQL